MNLETLRTFLGWCTLINFGLLTVWWVVFALGRGWIHRLHSRWVNIDRARMEAIHYQAMAGFKLAVILFNLTPWIALHLMA